MKKMYRWYSDECGHSIAGVVLAKNKEEAIEETINYLIDEFSDIAINNCEFALDKNFWVWEISTDDDYHEAHPNCIAVSY